MTEKLEMVTYVCATTSKKVEVPLSEDKGLPEGWLLPVHDISLDEWRDPLPKGTVLALSSEAAWKKLFNKRLNQK